MCSLEQALDTRRFRSIDIAQRRVCACDIRIITTIFIIIKEEYDPYVESTLHDIENSEKPYIKFAFYELIEAFNKCKKK